ncbi:hypothetical protein JGU66_34160 [Myxococcaceae bacterium JPH2]|nr:hypothetical protein [Myxococcaceae bacterium JPH2]
MLCAPAWADTLDLLGPTSAVPPEGFVVALARRGADGAPVSAASASVTAEGAVVRPGPDVPPLRTFTVVPTPGSREVVLKARDHGEDAVARYAVGPPAARVQLALTPPAPVKGRDTDAVLAVRLLRPDGTPDDSGAPPVLHASAGQVEGLRRTGPGEYTARYVLPDTRYPEVAILVALSAWPHPQSVHGAYGQVLVPLAASVELPGTTEPDAQISVEIAGTRFGPVAAGTDGRFRLPIVVPPGHRFGKGQVVDRVGNVRRMPIDLMLPPTDGLACVLHPQRLPADGVAQARLLCATSDPLGRPVADARVVARARHGQLEGPRRDPNGVLEWRYTAPRVLATDEVIEASWPQRGAESREERPLQLVQGPVASVAVEVSEPLVHYGGEAQVTVTARDALERARPAAQVAVKVPVGALSPITEGPAGTFRATWSLPDSGEVTRGEVVAHALGPQGSEPARLSVWLREGVLFAGVADLAGLPVPGQRLRMGPETRVTGDDGTVELGPARPGTLQVQHAVWPGLGATVYVLGPSGPVFPAAPPLSPGAVSRAVTLGPPLPVNVRIRVEGARVTYWVEDAKGRVLPSRPVHVSLSAGAREAESEREGRHSFTVGGARGAVTVSVADVDTGVTALEEVRP